MTRNTRKNPRAGAATPSEKISMMELWAAYCGHERVDFDTFSRGYDLLQADMPWWVDRGFGALREYLFSTPHTTVH